jgi:competence protein ComEC
MFDKAFREAPFLRVLLPFSVGIIGARQFTMPAITGWMTSGFLVLFLLLFIMLTCRPGKPVFPLRDRRYVLTAAVFQGLFLCMGLIMGREQEVARVPEGMLQARICDEILGGERTYKTKLDRVFYRSGEGWIRLEGRVQVYFQRDNRCRELVPGDAVSAVGQLLGYDDPVNPFEFNYGAYQRGKGVYYHLYLDSVSWMRCPAFTRRGLRVHSKLIRRTLMERIDQHVAGRDEKAILCALLLGYRDELGQDVKQQFVRSGSMHILAVSGLHVGILYILPAFLIGKIRRSGTLRLLATLALLAALWSYAWLTGLSPSVVRAVTMCSVHRTAVLAGRKTGIFHVLSLTAFIMVLFRPPILFETGFQLSFAAVAGIAGFQKPLSMLIATKGWLARSIWQLVTVSLSAQLATAPLSLFYFHQFSNAFILSNLAVIPLVTVILYAGLAFMMLSAVGLYPLSGILEWLTSLLEGITRLMGGVPGAFIENISLTPLQVLGLYLVCILACLLLRSRKVALCQALMAAAAFVLLVSGIREYRVRTQEGFFVFSIPRESAISFIRGKDHGIYRGGEVRGEPLQLPYGLRNFSLRHKLSPPVLLPAEVGSWMEQRCIDTGGVQLFFTRFRDRRIVILKQWPVTMPQGTAELPADILVLVDHVTGNPDSMMKVFKPGLIIMDGSSHPRYHDEMERTCRQRRIPFHSTEKDGFYAL